MSRSARQVAVSDSSTPATERSPLDVSVSWPAYFDHLAYQHTHFTDVLSHALEPSHRHTHVYYSTIGLRVIKLKVTPNIALSHSCSQIKIRIHRMLYLLTEAVKATYAFI